MKSEGAAAAQHARKHWVLVRTDAVKWNSLWRDPVTGKLWKEFYPRSEAHGGGPPSFETITEAQAQDEFGAK